MMMCIGSVTDFEAQMAEPPFGHASSGDYVELRTRSIAWEEARRCDAHGNCFGVPVEPPRPYSHGRRFIPAWLAEERELSMADGFSDDIGRTYSDLGSQARGFYHQTWIATFGSSVLRGRKLDPGEHYDGNFGLHGTIGTWLA